MEEIKLLIDELREDVLYNRKEITSVNTNVAKVVTSLEKILSEFQGMKEKINELEKKVETQDKEIDYLSREVRRNNLVITGVPESKDEQLITTTVDILKKADVSIDECNIDDVFRIGKNKGHRPILLKLNSHRKRQCILDAKTNFRELGFNVFPDRTKKDRDRFFKAKPYIMKYRNEGKTVRFMNGHLIVNGRRVTEQELEELETASKRKREKEEEGAKGPAAKLKQFAFRNRSNSESAASCP